MKNAIKTVASMALIWALAVAVLGVFARATWEVFMTGWNLL